MFHVIFDFCNHIDYHCSHFRLSGGVKEMKVIEDSFCDDLHVGERYKTLMTGFSILSPGNHHFPPYAFKGN